MKKTMKHLVPAFAVLLALPACVTANNAAQEPEMATEAAPVSTTETVDSPTETAGADQAELQSTLTEDLDQVEKLGQTFLESSFALYDRLLNEDISEKDTEAARLAVEDCRTKYNDLVVAIERLKASLNRTEVREALPLSVEGNKEELDAMLQSLAVYVPAQFNRDEYTVGEGQYLTAMMFPSLKEEMPEYMASLPKANRDALLLLDHLKRISGDLTSLSSTLTAWIYDAASFDAEAFVH